MVSAWSIGTSKRGFIKKNDTPGPGSYTPYQHHNNTPNKWKIGTEQTRAQKKSKNIPGPGTYQPNLSKAQTLRNFPSYAFGVKNYKYKYNDTPGPGQYSQNEGKIRREQPQYTFGTKTENFMNNKDLKYTPSPADYNIDRDKSVTTRPTSKIGSSNRKPLYFHDNQPGVGSYNVGGRGQGPQYSFGGACRATSARKFMDVPGPGAYKTNSQLNQTAKSFGVKVDDVNYLRAKREQPGPSDYEVMVSSVKKGQPGVKIGKEMRGKFFKEELYKPGPNAYRPQSVDKKKYAAYKIGTEQRGKLLHNDVPGPATYKIDSTIGQGKKYPIAEKLPKNYYNNSPGPADYELDMSQAKQRPASCKIGTSGRTKFEASKNPGPGTYFQNMNDSAGPHISFGRDVRGQLRANDTPGPGTYQIQPKFADVPQYLIQSQSKLMV